MLCVEEILEIVELLIEHGAKPSITNDLGRNVLSYVVLFVFCTKYDFSFLSFSVDIRSYIRMIHNSRTLFYSIFRYCEAFPAIKGAIQRTQREKNVSSRRATSRNHQSHLRSLILNQK